MCTVTVWRSPDDLRVTMNRDERWGRAPERPPVMHGASNGCPSWVAPADGERGGTWMGANHHGLVACLLNGYVAEDLELIDRPDVPSRGRIIPLLLEQPPGRAWSWLEDDLDPTPYPSFTLLVLDRERGCEVRWRRGEELARRSLEPGWSMVSSSFLRPEEILAWRHDQFASWVEAGAPLTAGVPAFNLLEEPGGRQRSPFMTRPYSATRSLTQAVVDSAGGEVVLSWWPRIGDGPVDAGNPEVTIALDLVATGPGVVA